ncbi:MAG: DUF924 family protein [Gammaproteobacteria bacterium]
MNSFDAILQYWLGSVEKTALPSTHRTWVWFSGDPQVDKEIKTQFYEDYLKAVQGDYASWEQGPRSTLALIILFDQFSRHIYRNMPQAFDQDRKALDLCLRGVEQQFDHMLSLMERVFFYFPLMHSENAEMQSLSLRAYEMLLTLSFQETRPIFEKFLDYAIRHHEIISRFGRFPYRNEVLGRTSTPAEEEFLKNAGSLFE